MRPWFLACLALACSSGALDEPEPPTGDQCPPVEREAFAACEPGDFAGAPAAQPVGSVEATLVDLDGNAPANLLVQVCGLDLCVSGETNAAGYSAVSVGDKMKLPAFKYGDGLSYAKIALLLEPPSDSVDLGELTVPALPAEGAAIAAGTTSSSAGAELTVSADAAVRFDCLTYRGADERAFRAAELPVERAPTALGEGLGFELFYALGPIDTAFCPPAELALPNSAGFEPGSEVEFFLHGLGIEERHAPYGGFAKFADGVVSEDGSVVRTTSGGVPLLSLVAVRRKP